MTMTVAEALESFYETRADLGHAFAPLFKECVKLTGLCPAIAFLLTAYLFPIEFQLYSCRLAGSGRPFHAGRWGLHFDDSDNAQWN